ncbi:MAG TPA: stage V sporulation protein AD [Clostridia bacterium]
MRLFDFGVEIDLNIKKGLKTIKRVNSKNTKKIGKQTILFENEPRIFSSHSIVSQKEKEGPLSEYFYDVISDSKFNEKTFEKAENKMFVHALHKAIHKAEILPEDIDVLIAGDLLSQIVSSSYCARLFEIPYLGIFGACSTIAEGLIIASMLIDGGFGDVAACVTGSHYATAERQFRGPVELGAQKQKYAQHTVTAAAALIVGLVGHGIRVTKACIGKVEDYGITDSANMGAAMAPAAMSTLAQFFEDTNTKPEDYDLIATGDLGKLGSDLLRVLLNEKGYQLGQNYMDCGAAIYHHDQYTSEGGSGCGCGASVLDAYILPKMRQGQYKKVLFVATGALLSTTIVQQGESIPCIAHLVSLEN